MADGDKALDGNIDMEAASSGDPGWAVLQQRIINCLPDAAIAVDCSGRVIAWNQAAEMLTGIPADQMLGRGDMEYSVPFYGTKRPTLLDLILDPALESQVSYQHLVRRGDVLMGENFCPAVGTNGAYLHASAAPIYDDRGCQVGAVETLRDATDKKATEDALLRITKAVDSASNAIWLTDNRGVDVIYCNQAFEDLFQYSSQELNSIGGTPQLYFDRTTARRVYETLKNGASYSGELTLRSRSGDSRVIFLHGDVVRDDNGRITSYIGIATDISDKKNIEAALIESQRQMANIIDCLPDATMVVDQNGQVIAWNRAMEDMTGVSSRDMLGKGDYEYALPFYNARRPILIDFVLNPSDSLETDYYPIFKESGVLVAETPPIMMHGREVVLWGKANVLYDSKGQPVGAIESIRDITDRKRAELEVKKSEAQYRHLIATANEGIWLVDPQYTTTFVNQKLADMLGYGIDELLGTPLFNYVFEEDLPLVEEKRERRAQGVQEQYELKFRRKDGSVLWTIISGSPIFDEEGRYTGALGMITDITKRMKAELELRESQRLMRTVIDFLPDPTLAIDMEGRVIFWNRAMEEMTGISAAEILGQGDYAYTIPFYGKRRPALIDLVFRSDEEIERDYSFIRKEKGVLIAETSSPCLKGRPVVLWGKANLLCDTSGKTVGAIESVRDITEKHRDEERLKQSYLNLKLTLEGTVNALSTTTEKKDPYTAGHQKRVARLACAIAIEMGLTDEQIDTIRIAGIIHDIGKIHLPSDILNKPGKISDLEKALIMTHSEVGYDIARTIPFDQPVASIILQHHERYDGSGYPGGLKKDEIMLEAQIIAVADVVEAMASHRPYRPALGVRAALQEISANRGRLYNPDIVAACLAVFAGGFELDAPD